ncbi:hypothetical protein VL03_17540 [Rossellomorea marisflavi]|nr:hypothetical protein VL03_17540 [Rossellomorea marisflavi]
MVPMKIGNNSKINLNNFLGFSLVNVISFSFIAFLTIMLTVGRVWSSVVKMNVIHRILNG